MLVTSPAAAAPDWSRAQVVNVVVMEDIFAPSHLVFRAGVTYHLHIENQGEELHKFAAPDFFVSSHRGRAEGRLSPQT